MLTMERCTRTIGARDEDSRQIISQPNEHRGISSFLGRKEEVEPQQEPAGGVV